MDFKEYEKAIPIDFKSDGCTMAPDGSWGSCCVIHDQARQDKAINDKTADRMLFNCMKDRGNIVLAVIYYFFVRVQSITGLTPVGLFMITGFLSIIGALMAYG